MTVEGRLAKVEAALTPTQRVLAWLDEAHAFGTLSDYVDSLLDQEPEALPLNRLAWDAAGSVRTARRGKPVEVLNAAVRKALRETVFRYDLVIRINVTAHELIEREALLHAVFAGQMALLMTDHRAARQSDPVYVRRMAQCRELTAGRVYELMAAQEARSLAEQRYLDGHPALFPDAIAECAKRLRLAQELAVMAERWAELDGLPPAEPPDPDAMSTRAAGLLADLVEPARSTALDKLDEGRQALAIATVWLRSKLTGDPEISASAEPSATIV